MANINKELNQIKNAIYGKDVRGSIHDGIDKINKETEIATDKANEAHDVMTDIINNGFDNAALEANFEQKLGEKIDNLQPEWTKFKDDTVTQLAQIPTDVNQIDFVEMLQHHNEVASTLYVKKIADRKFQVMIPFKGDKVAHYELTKDNNDDYIKFGFAKVSKLNYAEISRKSYKTITGGWNTTSAYNHFATEIGATFSLSFEGTGFDFVHYADNRGGVWKFEVDGKETRTLSTHVDALSDDERFPGVTGVRKIVRGLENTLHTVKATFLGDDPNNPPSTGVGTSRGWCRYYDGSDEDYHTIRVYGDDFGDVTEEIDILEFGSNKEYAIQCRPSDSTASYQWLPDHGIGTVFANSQKVFFDDQEITDWTPSNDLKEVKSVKVIQDMRGIHTSQPSSPLVNIISVHTITAKGVSVKVKIEFLRDTFILNGYGLMFPAMNGFAKELITSYGTRYASIKTDGTSTIIQEKDKANSYAFINNVGSDGEQDIVVALTVEDLIRSLRIGKEGRREDSLVWLQHRDNSPLQKLYTQVYKDYLASAGETFEISGTFFVGELPMADKLLP